MVASVLPLYSQTKEFGTIFHVEYRTGERGKWLVHKDVCVCVCIGTEIYR